MTQLALPEPQPLLPIGNVAEPEPTAKARLRPVRILALASALAVTPMITGLPQISGRAPASAHPVSSHVHHVGFVTSSVSEMRTARGATRSAASKAGAPDPAGRPLGALSVRAMLCHSSQARDEEAGRVVARRQRLHERTVGGMPVARIRGPEIVHGPRGRVA